MATVEKLAISLPKGDAARLDAAAKKLKVSRSAIVRNALRRFFDKDQELLVRDQYARYYANAETDREDEKIAKTMWTTSKKSWPKYRS